MWYAAIQEKRTVAEKRTAELSKAVDGKEGSMQKIINHLIQLQDLMVARAQQEAALPGARLAKLDASIKTMFDQLPPHIASQFRKMEKKGLLGIVPVTNGVCSACGMSIPVSLTQAVRVADALQQCPNCARILYVPQSSARTIGRKTRRGEPRKVGIERFSAPELMIPKLVSTTREDVIAELCSKMEAEGFVDNAKKLIEEALKREAIVSTAVGHGLAFPHVRGVEGGGLTMALGIAPKGVKFDPSSRSLTRIIFLVVIPTAASAFYLKLLSGLTQSFQKEDARTKLIKAGTQDKLWKALLKTTKTTVR